MSKTLLQELYTPLTKVLKENASGMIKLGNVCKISTNMEDADFWLQRKADVKNVGKVSKKFESENIGIKITNAGYDKQYLYYYLMHVYNSGYWKNKSKGTLKLQHISVSDVKDVHLPNHQTLKENYNKLKSKKNKLIENDLNNPLSSNSNIQNNNDQNGDDDLWHPGNIKQEFDSAKTSLNQIPATFSIVDKMGLWRPGFLVDIGGGREFTNDNGESIHKFTVALRSKNIRVAVFDPFNRTFEHNNMVAQEIKKSLANYSSANNVLNVIKEPENRARVIRQAYSALKDGPDSYAFFLIYEGDKSGQGKLTKIGTWQNNMKTIDYMPEIHKFFGKVYKKGNLIIAQK
jgi:hypothetical protein